VRPDLDTRLPLDDRIKSAAVRTGDIEVVRNSVNALKANSVPAHLSGKRILAHLPAPAEEITVDATRDLEITARLASLRRAPDAFELETRIRTRWVDVHGATMELVLRNRSRAAPDIVSPIQLVQPAPGEVNEGTQRTWSAALPVKALADAPPGRWDAYVVVSSGRRAPSAMAEARLRRRSEASSHMDSASVDGRTIQPYITIYDNLSFELSSTKKQDARSRLSARVPIRFSPKARSRVRRWAGQVLGRLGLTMIAPGGGTVVISRRSDVSVTPADSRSVVVSLGDSLKVTQIDGVGPVVTDRDARVEPLASGGGTVLPAEATDQELFDRHTAVYRRLVSEHVAHIVGSYDVNCVLDVGANKGQFARELRRSGYRGHIVSFEPVPDIFARLKRVAAGDAKWTVLPYALGREDGSIEMKVVFGTMSSALGPTDYGRQRYKRFRNITTVDVPLRRLDGLLDEIVPDEVSDPRWYLKLDTQGFDVEVFAGLGDRVTEIVAMQSEMALLSIYEGMPRLPAALETYEAAGFEVSGMFPVTREKDTGRVLEFDCVLVRADALEGDDG
jgi:FkbM family methyltransferase